MHRKKAPFDICDYRVGLLQWDGPNIVNVIEFDVAFRALVDKGLAFHHQLDLVHQEHKILSLLLWNGQFRIQLDPFLLENRAFRH